MTVRLRETRWSVWVRWGATTLWLIALSVYLSEVILIFVNEPFMANEIGPWAQALVHLPFAMTATLGWLILRSQPRNIVGWWVLIAGLSFPLEAAAAELTDYGLREWGVTTVVTWAYWLAGWTWIGTQLSLSFVVLYYPDGQLPSRRWRPVAWVMWSILATLFFFMATLAGDDPDYPMLGNPLAIELPDTVYPIVGDFLEMATGLVLPILAALSLISRFRSAGPVVRQQIKFIAWLAGVSIIFFGFMPDLSASVAALTSATFTLFASGTIAAAVTRYRLFDIDRLISRTIAYVVVVGLLGGIFVFAVVAVPNWLLGTESPPPLVVACSTLAIAALFNPLRIRVQRSVDRRFNRSRYDAERVMDGFVGSLRDRMDGEEVVAGWVDVVSETMQPSSVGVWLKN